MEAEEDSESDGSAVVSLEGVSLADSGARLNDLRIFRKASSDMQTKIDRTWPRCLGLTRLRIGSISEGLKFVGRVLTAST